jgi:hypothetical protein
VLYTHRSNFLHALVTVTSDMLAIGAGDTVLMVTPMVRLLFSFWVHNGVGAGASGASRRGARVCSLARCVAPGTADLTTTMRSAFSPPCPPHAPLAPNRTRAADSAAAVPRQLLGHLIQW